MRMSYLVGYESHYPRMYITRASFRKNKLKYNCKGGWKWRDNPIPNPNVIIRAMVARPDRHDKFYDLRTNYNYIEPTLSSNARLIPNLVFFWSGANYDRNWKAIKDLDVIVDKSNRDTTSK